MKKLCSLLLFASALAVAQNVDNTVYVKQFAGSDIGTKVANAQKSCTPNLSIPCYVVLDPSLAVFAAGTMPALCTNCHIVDWRNGGPFFGSATSQQLTVDVIGASYEYNQGNQCTPGWAPIGNCWPPQLATLMGWKPNINQAVGGSPIGSQVAASLHGTTPGVPSLPWIPNSIVLMHLGENDTLYQNADYLVCNAAGSPGDSYVVNGTTVTLVASGATGNQVNIGADALGTCNNIQAFSCPDITYSGSPAIIPGCGNSDSGVNQSMYDNGGTSTLAYVRLLPLTPNGSQTLSTASPSTFAVRTSPPSFATQQSNIYRQMMAFIALQEGETAAQAPGGVASIYFGQQLTAVGPGCAATSVHWGSGYAENATSTCTLTAPAPMRGSAFHLIMACGDGFTGSVNFTVTPSGGTPVTNTSSITTSIVGYAPSYESACDTELTTPYANGDATVTVTYVSGFAQILAVVSNGNAASGPQRTIAVVDPVTFNEAPEAGFNAARAGVEQAVAQASDTDQFPVVLIPVGKSFSCADQPVLNCGTPTGGYNHLNFAAIPRWLSYFTQILSPTVTQPASQAYQNGPFLSASATGPANLTCAQTDGSGHFSQCTAVTATSFNGLPIATFSTDSQCAGGIACPSTTGVGNTGFGNAVFNALTSGTQNTAVGSHALSAIITQSSNTAVGNYAGHWFTGNNALTNVGQDVFLGAFANAKADNSSNEDVICYLCFGHGTNTFTLGNSSIVGTYLQGTMHYTGAAPVASAGTITGSNQGGFVAGLSAATTVTLTFANSGYATWASCTANTSVTATQPYVSAISITAVTFTFPSLTGTLYYHCNGN